jgi:putative sterol carrier protein
MSDLITAAVSALQARITAFPDGTARFFLPGEGSILIGPEGVRAGDGAADVTLTASAELFRGILEGRVNPMTAFMTGKLTVEGDMPLALKLAKSLA